MTQFKLKPDEVAHIEMLRSGLRSMFAWEDTNQGHGYWNQVDNELGAMLEHGTTDGKPYVDPQPEIGGGYRAATKEDEGRKDRQYYYDGQWHDASVGTADGTYYRVPVDRIPTDLDARERPLVMVRDKDDAEWIKRPLLAVTGTRHPFIVGSGNGHTFWAQCRFPYPGE